MPRSEDSGSLTMTSGNMVIVLDFVAINGTLRGNQWVIYPPRSDTIDLYDPKTPKDRNGNPRVWVSFDAVGVNDEFAAYADGLVQIRKVPDESVQGPNSIARNGDYGGRYDYDHEAVDRVVVAMSAPAGYSADEFEPWPEDAKEAPDGRLGLLYHLRPTERIQLHWTLNPLEEGETIGSEVARIKNRTPRSKGLILFIHGLGGDSAATWGRFPDFLLQNSSIARRYATASLSYPTAIWRLPFSRKTPRIQVLAAALRTQINQRFRDYNDITLVCHSLGGIIARQYALEEIKRDNPLKVTGLVLFAVPNNGAQLATVGQYVSWRHWQLKQLSKESDFLDLLNNDWINMKASDRFRMKYVDGMQDRVVDRSSALFYVGNQDSETIEGGHIDMVKPTRPDDVAVIIVRNFLLANTKGRGKPLGGAADARVGDHERKRMIPDFDKERIDRLSGRFSKNEKTPRHL
jgi:pimeloyl-ACP methyl ester carboxylesterase